MPFRSWFYLFFHLLYRNKYCTIKAGLPQVKVCKVQHLIILSIHLILLIAALTGSPVSLIRPACLLKCWVSAETILLLHTCVYRVWRYKAYIVLYCSILFHFTVQCQIKGNMLVALGYILFFKHVYVDASQQKGPKIKMVKKFISIEVKKKSLSSHFHV